MAISRGTVNPLSTSTVWLMLTLVVDADRVDGALLLPLIRCGARDTAIVIMVVVLLVLLPIGLTA